VCIIIGLIEIISLIVMRNHAPWMIISANVGIETSAKRLSLVISTFSGYSDGTKSRPEVKIEKFQLPERIIFMT
jgi:hypothetical protein